MTDEKKPEIPETKEEKKANEIKENLSDSSMWVRILFVVLFLIIYFLARYLVFFLVVINAISNLITGKSFDTISKFAKQLNFFIFQCMEYITFVSDTKPYPFTSWASDEEAQAMHQAAKNQTNSED